MAKIQRQFEELQIKKEKQKQESEKITGNYLRLVDSKKNWQGKFNEQEAELVALREAKKVMANEIKHMKEGIRQIHKYKLVGN